MLGVKHLSTFRTLGVLALALIVAPLQAAAAQDARAGNDNDKGKPQLVRADEGKGFHTDDGKPVAAEVMVLLASGEEGAIDPSLSHLRALKHPPFSEYKTLKLLSRLQVKLPHDQPVEIALPNGRTLVLRLVSLGSGSRWDSPL